MCGRFALYSLLEDIEYLFALKGSAGIPPRYNIAPRQPVLIVRNNEAGKRELAAVEWGLVPEWKKEIGDKPLINARVETVEVKPSFRSSVKRKRCLIPFNGWFEWKPEQGRKQPYFFEPNDKKLHAFAGIWSTWHGPGGDHWLETMAILTAPATGHFRNIHHRKPLIVKPSQFDAWLTAHDPLPRGFLNSFDWVADDAFGVRPVNSRVSNVRFDDPSCIEPAQPVAQHSLF